ncbi:fumarylacetoacetate hydrolase family protein [Variovorax sp. Root411]|uniref:fumarylacetoacetate hydrolase family protein n=1 Tax=Variovorax sp. Root411 TaxID=1736530 RepID=UPI0006FF3D58|nr:fumarylacetoacetate hydrolase family protein [Variovorax sp. Root411]KQW64886.1 5-carboxymethyl-2-hydroxymuconate isomerase [Variovorax sp. Root411]
MKLISFEHNGKVSFGAVVGDSVIDLGTALEGRFADLKGLLEGDGIAAAKAAIEGRTPELKLAEITFLPVIPNPGKIWCAGLNYGEHVRETGREVSEQPMFFLRFADSQVGHGQAIQRPPESVKLDYEGEIAVIIGKGGRRISEADAWDHIAGYACYNDGSIRDWQLHTQQWCPGKNFWRTGGFGPWMVTTDEIEAGATLSLVTRLNGAEVQRATTDMMLHSIPRQIAYASTVAPLQPGDVFVTGTPGGIGAKRTPQLWMKSGDVVEVEVERVGILRNTIVDEQVG